MKRRMTVGLLVVLLILLGCDNGTAELLAVVPNTIPAGSGNVLLHLTGKNFTNPVSVVWTGKQVGQLVTTLVNSQQLTALVPAAFVATSGVASIMALQGGTNQTATQPLTITIGNVAPTLTGMAPMHIIVGAPSFTLTVTGTNFNSTSVVNWGATALTTTFVSATSLTAQVPQTLYAAAGTAKVTVVNGGTGGGTSAQMTFTIVAPLAITTASLPGGSIGSPYTTTLAATGGVVPYSWSILSGSLPAGLALNGSTGVISGTPTAAGSASFTVQCTDSTGALARRVIQ